MGRSVTHCLAELSEKLVGHCCPETTANKANMTATNQANCMMIWRTRMWIRIELRTDNPYDFTNFTYFVNKMLTFENSEID